ncbi:MAG: HAD family phosphatase [Endomicrobiales bacterium]|nr:HAD family phosphatase [Endomicrobiales bacterium]
MKKLIRKPQAVLFDMDGVIVDSMPYHFIAWYETLKTYGARVTAYDIYMREGEKWEKSTSDFLKKAGVRPTKRILKDVYFRREKIFKKYFRLNIFKDVTEIIKCLKSKGYMLALVTGTNKSEVKKILPERIFGQFDAIVTGSDVKTGKPHPAPYLKAAKMLKLKARECVVIENAPYGIRAAKKAGMFTFAVTTSLPKYYLREADVIVEKMVEIITYLDKTCRVKTY